MEYADYLRFVFALLFVVSLIGGTAMLARRFGLAPGAATGNRNTQKRLEIVETLALDPKRRVVIIRRDGVQHLILLGADKEQVIEQSFTAPAQLPVTTEDATETEALGTAAATVSPPSDDDDVFARLRKVAELMNEKRALALRTGHSAPHKAAGGRA